MCVLEGGSSVSAMLAQGLPALLQSTGQPCPSMGMKPLSAPHTSSQLPLLSALLPNILS